MATKFTGSYAPSTAAGKQRPNQIARPRGPQILSPFCLPERVPPRRGHRVVDVERVHRPPTMFTTSRNRPAYKMEKYGPKPPPPRGRVQDDRAAGVQRDQGRPLRLACLALRPRNWQLADAKQACLVTARQIGTQLAIVIWRSVLSKHRAAISSSESIPVGCTIDSRITGQSGSKCAISRIAHTAAMLSGSW